MITEGADFNQNSFENILNPSIENFEDIIEENVEIKILPILQDKQIIPNKRISPEISICDDQSRKTVRTIKISNIQLVIEKPNEDYNIDHTYTYSYTNLSSTNSFFLNKYNKSCFLFDKNNISLTPINLHSIVNINSESDPQGPQNPQDKPTQLILKRSLSHKNIIPNKSELIKNLIKKFQIPNKSNRELKKLASINSVHNSKVFEDSSYLENKLQEQNSKANLDLNLKPQICGVCYGVMTNSFYFKCCNKKYCFDCSETYFNELLKNGNFTFKCPNAQCLKNVPIEVIKQYFFKLEHFEKYNKFTEIARIKKIEGHVFCPIPDCESYAINTESRRLLECFDNKHKFCSICLKPFHEGGCSIDIVVNLVQAREQNIKKCPRCKVHIQKNSGCNHMKCLNIGCLYEFCWLCMGSYSQNHYSNPFTPCYKRANDDSGVDITPVRRCAAVCRGLGFIFLFLMIISIILTLHTVIIGVILSFYYIKENRPFRIEYSSDKLNILHIIMSLCIFTSIGLSCLSLGFIIFAIIIATSPFWLMVLCCYALQRKYRHMANRERGRLFGLHHGRRLE